MAAIFYIVTYLSNKTECTLDFKTLPPCAKWMIHEKNEALIFNT